MDSFISKILGINEEVRQPRFAGTWYPSQSLTLDKNLSDYLQEAKLKSIENKDNAAGSSANGSVLAIIVPHAGYQFSGKTAAYAYQALLSQKYKRVFLLGPSHHIAFKGVVFPTEKTLQTPLGELIVDKTCVNRLLQEPYFSQSNTLFDTEHSLEMQLPWIRKTLGKVQLVPMAVGIIGEKEIASISQAIRGQLTPGDLLVVSSDFTHYGPRFGYQPFANEQSSASLNSRIKDLDSQAFDCLKTLDSKTLLDFYARTGDTICGIYPSALLLSLLPPGTNTALAKYSTSQQSAKDADGNSVSYMAIVFSAAAKADMSANKKTPRTTGQIMLSEHDGQQLLKIARLCLQDYLEGQQKNPQEYASAFDAKQHFLDKRGVFVTLYTKPKAENQLEEQSPAQRLRGCIGYIYPEKNLLVGVCENAINAATKDPRFKAITLSELDQLAIEISVLTAPHPINNWQEINLGKDGIVLHKFGKQAVFLPKVASEFGWDLPQTLSQLSAKAGLSPSDWHNGALFEVFQSQTFAE